VIGLQVRLERRDDRHALTLGQSDVLVDEVDVRVGYGERALGLATEQVRGARGRVV
jgi:hypothetical protein